MNELTVKWLKSQLALRKNSAARHIQVSKLHAGQGDLRTANAAIDEANRDKTIANDIQMILDKFE